MQVGLARHVLSPGRRRDLGRVRNRVVDVEGWLSDEEGMLLYELARLAPGRGALVEIGSWKGRSTIWLASGSRAGRGSPIVAVDPHVGLTEHHEELGKVDTHVEFEANLANAHVADLVRPVVETSVEAAQNFAEPVDLVFIDGAHDYASVCADIDAWFPRILPSGVLAFHDATATWPDVLRAINNRLIEPGAVDRVRFVHSVVYARKRARPSRRAAMMGAVILSGKSWVDRARPRAYAAARSALAWRSRITRR